MKYREILTILQRLAPEDSALEGDPVGLLIEPAAETIQSVVVCLDATGHVAQTAIDEHAGLIIAHHPLIYRPLAKLESADPVGAVVLSLTRNGIGLYAMHTNWDAADSGINDTLAELIGIEGPKRFPGGPDVRIARIGSLAKPVPADVFLADIEKRLNCCGASALRFAIPSGELRPIKTVAVCGGAGAFLVPEAIKAGADAFVTADVRHHEFIDAAARGLLLVDAGHGATESPGMRRLARTLAAQLPEIYTTFCDNQAAT